MGQKMPFATWLLGQVQRTDDVGKLAQAVKLDRGFPRDGDVKALSKRLNAQQADQEMHEALERAEMDWAAY